MTEEELTSFVEHLRSNLDGQTFSEEDAFNQVWNSDNELTSEQREQVHQTLELSSPIPSPLEFFVTDAIGKRV